LKFIARVFVRVLRPNFSMPSGYNVGLEKRFTFQHLVLSVLVIVYKMKTHILAFNFAPNNVNNVIA
jgi:hypothetical protein